MTNKLDLQSILSNAVQAKRQEELKTSPQLTLGEIILKLESVKNKKLPVVFDIKKYHPMGIDSWRGSYCELALEYIEEGESMVLGSFTKMLKDTIGKTLIGYKGGDFLMGRITPVWVANNGECGGFREDGNTAVIDVLENKKAVIIKTKEMEY